MRKNKKVSKRRNKKIYKVMWSYYDYIGSSSGVVDIEANSRADAEKEFYKYNRNYVLKHIGGKTVFNPMGGYVCESVMTVEEWIEEGRPTRV